MPRAKIFTSGNSQTVLLPPDIRFEEDEVAIKKVGRVVMIFPNCYHAADLMAMCAEVGMEIARDAPMPTPARPGLED